MAHVGLIDIEVVDCETHLELRIDAEYQGGASFELGLSDAIDLRDKLNKAIESLEESGHG